MEATEEWRWGGGGGGILQACMEVHLASRTSSTTSTMFSCSLRRRSALAMCPGYHWTSRGVCTSKIVNYN